MFGESAPKVQTVGKRLMIYFVWIDGAIETSTEPFISRLIGRLLSIHSSITWKNSIEL